MFEYTRLTRIWVTGFALMLWLVNSSKADVTPSDPSQSSNSPAANPTTPHSDSLLTPKYVPADAKVVIVARPDSLSPLFNTTPDGTTGHEEFKFFRGMTSLTIWYHVPSVSDKSTRGNQPRSGNEAKDMWYMTFTDQEARDSLANNLVSAPPGVNKLPPWTKVKQEEIEYELHVMNKIARFYPDETSLLIGDAALMKSALEAGPTSASPLTTTEAWTEATRGSIAFAGESSSFQAIIESSPPNRLKKLVSPPWTNSVRHTLGITVGEKIDMRMTSESKNEAEAKKFEVAVKNVIKSVKTTNRSTKSRQSPLDQNAADAVQQFADGINISREEAVTSMALETNRAELIAVVMRLISN